MIIINRRFLQNLGVCSLCIVFSFCAQAQSSGTIQGYIASYRKIALEQERRYGIPASITLAQGILESRAGTSGLALSANNHFGIKIFGGWSGPVYYAWDDEPQKSAFRKYNSANESYEDHARFLMDNSRYRFLFDISVFNYRGWANGLQTAGYATSPTYAKALIGYIEAYQLYAINGGVKLPAGKKVVIERTITIEELVKNEDIQMAKNEISEEEESVSATIQGTSSYAGRDGIIVEINNVRCTTLYPGETLASISMQYDIPQSKLLEYNEATSKEDFKEGDIVFLEKKGKKYTGTQDYYHVRNGESLYQISQKFGIRLNNLAKLNHLSLFSSLPEGQRLKLK